jgi:hypothetical protein
MRISNENKPLPYIMTRTAKGVSFVGIDGMDYLTPDSRSQPVQSATDTT